MLFFLSLSFRLSLSLSAKDITTFALLAPKENNQFNALNLEELVGKSDKMLPKDFTEISSQMRAVLIYLFFPPSPGKKKKKRKDVVCR